MRLCFPLFRPPTLRAGLVASWGKNTPLDAWGEKRRLSGLCGQSGGYRIIKISFSNRECGLLRLRSETFLYRDKNPKECVFFFSFLTRASERTRVFAEVGVKWVSSVLRSREASISVGWGNLATVTRLV